MTFTDNVRSCSRASRSKTGTRVSAWLSPTSSTCGPEPWTTVQDPGSSPAHQCSVPCSSSPAAFSKSIEGTGRPSCCSSCLVDAAGSVLAAAGATRAGLRSEESTGATTRPATRALTATPVTATGQPRVSSRRQRRTGISRIS